MVLPLSTFGGITDNIGGKNRKLNVCGSPTSIGAATGKLFVCHYYESVVATLREKLFGARVSTSKYLFSVGLTGKTDPAGRQMEYNYDSQGRLIETCRFNEQGQRNLTGFHQYHLVNESN